MPRLARAALALPGGLRDRPRPGELTPGFEDALGYRWWSDGHGVEAVEVEYVEACAAAGTVEQPRADEVLVPWLPQLVVTLRPICVASLLRSARATTDALAVRLGVPVTWQDADATPEAAAIEATPVAETSPTDTPIAADSSPVADTPLARLLALYPDALRASVHAWNS